MYVKLRGKPHGGFRPRCVGLWTVTYECQKCGVHFEVIYPEENQILKIVKCPLCQKAKALAFSWDDELDYLFKEKEVEVWVKEK